MDSLCKPLYVAGIGPGGAASMTQKVLLALEAADCIVGYGLYVELLAPELISGKHIVTSGMRHERERCEKAVDLALSGKTTILISSGDPGIYGMASLVIEILARRQLINNFPLEIMPGVSSLCAAAAALGAPIGHDFACISLSDLLTPWTLIEKRLEAAFASDLVTILFNPRSRGRPDNLARAIELAKKWRVPTCPVGLCRNIQRAGEETWLTDLANFTPERADMLSLIFIGASQSCQTGRWMLTPRGYKL